MGRGLWGTLCKSSSWASVSPRQWKGVVPAGGWGPCGVPHTGYVEGQRAWATGRATQRPLSVRPLWLPAPPVVFLARLCGPLPPSFLSPRAKHLEESETLAPPAPDVVRFPDGGCLPSRCGRNVPCPNSEGYPPPQLLSPQEASDRKRDGAQQVGGALADPPFGLQPLHHTQDSPRGLG